MNPEITIEQIDEMIGDVDWDDVDPDEPPRTRCDACGVAVDTAINAPDPLQALFCVPCAKNLGAEMMDRGRDYALQERLDRLDDLEGFDDVAEEVDTSRDHTGDQR